MCTLKWHVAMATSHKGCYWLLADTRVVTHSFYSICSVSLGDTTAQNHGSWSCLKLQLHGKFKVIKVSKLRL
ncbi:hypothetical protein XELAEV_18023345mg [Xenopus laevis]|uniref:Uncharacterized protein n=1 Tax=Xenopus laevis TaxID=8355 RepID=A0A974D5Z1_XENLA|nr:hypothetical protein XELAEV_18023345mg [Xenopus laevis]